MRVLSIALVLITLFLLVIINLTERITQPIIQLTKLVKDSVNNRFKPITGIQSEGEVQELSNAFNETITQLNEHTLNLEVLVEDRTRALSTAYSEIEETNFELKKKNRKLETIASIDPLTELYNRRAFNKFAEEAMTQSARHDKPIALILMDIDHFKRVNDSYGHDVGDTVLSRVAHLLTVHTDNGSVICRWGGEEFILLIEAASSTEAVTVAEKLRHYIANEKFGPIEKLTVSAGVATYLVSEPFKDWVHRADIALYSAKEKGRNCVVVSSDPFLNT